MDGCKTVPFARSTSRGTWQRLNGQKLSVRENRIGCNETGIARPDALADDLEDGPFEAIELLRRIPVGARAGDGLTACEANRRPPAGTDGGTEFIGPRDLVQNDDLRTCQVGKREGAEILHDRRLALL